MQPHMKKMPHLLVSLLFVTIAIGCHKSPPENKAKSGFPQSQVLDDNTRVILSDAWIFNESQQHLRVLFTYQGKNPGQTYSEKATLRAAEQGPDIQGKLTQQSLWAPVTSSNRLQLLWMFPDFPKDTPQIFLRLDFTERNSTQIVKSLEFTIPGSRALPKRKLNQGG